MQAEVQAKEQLMRLEFDFNMQLAQINGMSLADREKMKEKSKDARVSIQNSQQSKLINQRKNNLPPINFESNEDSLDGFDLSEFSPR
jgi:hypothetical protein